ncbi:hypothetical protein GCM10023212_03980 [Luteolibacter yonseiensis]
MTSHDGISVSLRLGSGKVVSVPIATLSAEDQAFIKIQPEISIPPESVTPAEQRIWPDLVTIPNSELEKVTIEKTAEFFIYRSPSFEFTCSANLLPALTKEIPRTFEATKRLIDALPWGITCRPPAGRERFLAALYPKREDYERAGGPSNSGGVYMSKDKTFRIPFESLGIRKVGESYTRDKDFDNDTLVHEITHQMMDEYLPFLPKWAVEGTAELTGMLPYKTGTFRSGDHRKGLVDYLARPRIKGTKVEFPDLDTLFRMTRSEWDKQSSRFYSGGNSDRQRELYEQSALLVYYFNFLDAEPPTQGRRWIRFMDAVKGEIGKWNEYQAAFDTYRKDMDEFMKLPGVRQLEGARFSYPQGFTPPSPPASPDGQGKIYSEQTPFKHVDILLDGRSLEQVSEDIRLKFSQSRIKLNE